MVVFAFVQSAYVLKHRTYIVVLPRRSVPLRREGGESEGGVEVGVGWWARTASSGVSIGPLFLSQFFVTTLSQEILK